MRIALGIITGYVTWTVLWLAGNAALGASFRDAYQAFADGGRFDDPMLLAFSLVLSVVCSVVAGFAAAKVGREQASAAVWGAAIALLATGIGVQVSAWDRMPIWYHLVFLVLIVPACRIGGSKAGA